MWEERKKEEERKDTRLPGGILECVLEDEIQLARGTCQRERRCARAWGEVQAGRAAHAELLRENGVAQDSGPLSTGGISTYQLLCEGCYTEVLRFSPNCDDDLCNNLKLRNDSIRFVPAGCSAEDSDILQWIQIY